MVSRQFGDHHTAMTTALSTSFYLPDVMALEVGYVGRFAQGGGLEDLAQRALRHRAASSRAGCPMRYQQATSRKGAVVAAPTDIGPGTLLYRADLLAKAGVSEAELTRSWDSYVAAGAKIKAATGAYLMAHARDMKDIVIRTGIQPGEGLYFDKQSQRAGHLAALRARLRAGAQGAPATSSTPGSAPGPTNGPRASSAARIATQMTGAWLAGHLNNWLAPDTKGLWRAAQLPEGAFAAYGGTFFAIPRGAPAAHKAAGLGVHPADDAGPRACSSAAFKSQDAFPALLETYDDPFFEQPIAFLGGQTARVGWRDGRRAASPRSTCTSRTPSPTR